VHVNVHIYIHIFNLVLINIDHIRVFYTCLNQNPNTFKSLFIHLKIGAKWSFCANIIFENFYLHNSCFNV